MRVNPEIFNRDVLLSSIDETLATLRAALAAGEDPEQTQEVRTYLAALFGRQLGRLPDTPGRGWEGIPGDVFDAVARAQQAATGGDVDMAHSELVAAREMLGGRSA